MAELEEALSPPRRNGVTLSTIPIDSDMTAFLHLVAPLVDRAYNHLLAEVETLVGRQGGCPLNAIAAVKIAGSSLPGLLLPMLSRTLVLELNVARLHGTLRGDNERERFVSFTERLRDGYTRLSILHEYPVLARAVADQLRIWTEFQLELFSRLCADWGAIRRVFANGDDPGTLVQMHPYRGDTHRRGRSVVVLEFESGLSLVYKPKALAVDVHFQMLVAWLSERAILPVLSTPDVLDRGSYGWAEFVPFRECTSSEQVTRFYERQGAYLAILHALEAVDLHYENLISSGEHPFLVDLETLFHPRVGADLVGADPASEMLRTSILRVGLLPHRKFSSPFDDGIDLSGLGAVPGQRIPFAMSRWESVGTDEMRMRDEFMQTTGARNLPTLNGRGVDPLDYADALAEGFAASYRALVENRDALLADGGPLSLFSNDETRVLLRPTVGYSALAAAGWHPDVLRDALDRDALFGWLWLDARRESHLRRVLAAELKDLRAGDIPMFVTRPSSVDLWTSSGERIAGFFEEPALNLVRRTVNEMGEVDLERQLWLLRCSLTTLAMSGDRRPEPRGRIATADGNLDPTRLVAAAREIGRRLGRMALRNGSEVSWLGVSFNARQRWSLAAPGIGLYDGLSGIALFLSYLASLCDETPLEDLARGTLDTIRHSLESGSTHQLSIGAFDGRAGVVYLLTHLGCLWRDERLLAEAAELAQALPSSAPDERAFDVVGGSAGAMACIIALHRVAPSQDLLEAAVRLGDDLLRHAQHVGAGIAWSSKIPCRAPLTGFSHGASGIGWALGELSDITGEERFRDAALEAFRYERGCFSEALHNWPDYRTFELPDGSDDHRKAAGVAWCHGAAGIALARLRASRYLDDPEILPDLEDGLATTLREGFGGNHSLCHGDLGNLEVVLQARELLGAAWEPEFRRLAWRILESGRVNGWLSGIPLGVESPGLMTGLSGIGYGLLRAALPDRVPSVLVLDPPC